MTEAAWYKKAGLSQVAGFLDPKDRKKLKQLAQKSGRSLVKYVTRILEAHIQEEEKKEVPLCENCKNFHAKTKMR